MIAGQEGGCDCGKIRYRLHAEPIVVKCCHCRACQRQTGSAFTVNVVIEAEHVELLGDAPEPSNLETLSGHGQQNMRCPSCKVSVWSVFNQAGGKAFFMRGGTLDDTARLEPDLHIYTESKQPWVVIPEGAEVFEAFYTGRDVVRVFGVENAARWKAVLSR